MVLDKSANQLIIKHLANEVRRPIDWGPVGGQITCCMIRLCMLLSAGSCLHYLCIPSSLPLSAMSR